MKALLVILFIVVAGWLLMELFGALASAPAWAWAMYFLFSLTQRTSRAEKGNA